MAAGQNLAVLTRDSALVETLRALGTSGYVLVPVRTESDLAAKLLGGFAGVAIVDAGAVASPIEQVTERLKTQFPDLVLIVAGRQDDQGALTAQITNGSVYRFLHKPVSEQRVKHFVDAAWRRYSESGAEISQQDAIAAEEAARSTGPATRNAVIAGGAAIVVLLTLGGWLLSRNIGSAANTDLTAQGPVARNEELEDLLRRADDAFAAGRLNAPAGENAAELYTEALQRGGTDPRPAAGLEKVIDKLLSAAESRLAEQHLDEAQRLVEQARALEPNHVRVAFLTAQISKMRERAARHAVLGGSLKREAAEAASGRTEVDGQALREAPEAASGQADGVGQSPSEANTGPAGASTGGAGTNVGTTGTNTGGAGASTGTSTGTAAANTSATGASEGTAAANTSATGTSRGTAAANTSSTGASAGTARSEERR